MLTVDALAELFLKKHLFLKKKQKDSHWAERTACPTPPLF